MFADGSNQRATVDDSDPLVASECQFGRSETFTISAAGPYISSAVNGNALTISGKWFSQHFALESSKRATMVHAARSSVQVSFRLNNLRHVPHTRVGCFE
jgi:hypothetical protein